MVIKYSPKEYRDVHVAYVCTLLNRQLGYDFLLFFEVMHTLRGTERAFKVAKITEECVNLQSSTVIAITTRKNLKKHN